MSDDELLNYQDELEQIWNALVLRSDMPGRVDAIIVGGCTDLGLAERTAELYHSGISSTIIISGYQPEGLEISEAELLANHCISLGVDKKAIILEKKASNTGENILFSAKLANQLLQKVDSVALVHMPTMSLRFLATAEAQWPAPQPKFYSTCQLISFKEYCDIHGLRQTAWDMLGDFKRMDEYVKMGYQTKQHIPNSARTAYDKVIESGFTTR